MNQRRENVKARAWKRWKREYIHSLMESHWLNKEMGSTPVVGEVVLLVGDERNRRELNKGKILHLMLQGRIDGVVQGVVLPHKGCMIERPIQLICPFEIQEVDYSPGGGTAIYGLVPL